MIPDKDGWWWYVAPLGDKMIAYVIGSHGSINNYEQYFSVSDKDVFSEWIGPVQDVYADVLSFHEKFAPSIIGKSPRWPDFKYYGTEFIEEELKELKDAEYRGNMEGVADALADIIYVVNRKAIIMGIDLRPIHDEVHAANMRKVGGELRDDNKVMKPPGWTPPDVAGCLEAQGWDGGQPR